jgi:hypothetical protein
MIRPERFIFSGQGPKDTAPPDSGHPHRLIMDIAELALNVKGRIAALRSRPGPRPEH